MALLSTEGAVRNGKISHSKAYFLISNLLCNILMILSIYANIIPAALNLTLSHCQLRNLRYHLRVTIDLLLFCILLIEVDLRDLWNEGTPQEAASETMVQSIYCSYCCCERTDAALCLPSLWCDESNPTSSLEIHLSRCRGLDAFLLRNQSNHISTGFTRDKLSLGHNPLKFKGQVPGTS